MTASIIRKKQQAVPFIPFDFLLAGEKRIHVPHPDYMFISPSGRFAEVSDKNDDETTLDVFLILGVQDHRKAASSKRGK